MYVVTLANLIHHGNMATCQEATANVVIVIANISWKTLCFLQNMVKPVNALAVKPFANSLERERRIEENDVES